MLDELGLFEDLAVDFADLCLSQSETFTSSDLADIVPRDEVSLESHRQRSPNWSGTQVERKRLKHVPALLAGTLARRLGWKEDAVQTLWTAVGLRDESCVAAFQQVVERASSDPVLRPFALALVERWETSQAASS